MCFLLRSLRVGKAVGGESNFWYTEYTMQIVTDSDRDFLSMLGTFGVIILTSFMIIIVTNALRKGEDGMTARVVDVATDGSEK
jgi:hypothetical protein